MTVPVVVTTSNKHMWALRPFAYLFNIFWSSLQKVYVVGFAPPEFELPPNFTFISYPSEFSGPEKWSTVLLAFVSELDDSHFIFMLEDYWLVRAVDHVGLGTLAEYCRHNPRVLRMDLTTDRLHARGDARLAVDREYYGHYDIIETSHDLPYQMSLQAAIFNRALMLEVLERERTPWEVEIYTDLSSRPDILVLGTRQWPVRYANVLLKGEFQLQEFYKIPSPHAQHIRSENWVPGRDRSSDRDWRI